MRPKVSRVEAGAAIELPVQRVRLLPHAKVLRARRAPATPHSERRLPPQISWVQPPSADSQPEPSGFTVQVSEYTVVWDDERKAFVEDFTKWFSDRQRDEAQRLKQFRLYREEQAASAKKKAGKTGQE